LALRGSQIVIGLNKPLTMDKPAEIPEYWLTDSDLNTPLTQTDAAYFIWNIVDATRNAQFGACNQLF